MSDQEEIDASERAARAIRGGNAADALSIYDSLLRKVTVLEPGLYEGWLEGALGAYQMLDRRREAGCVLLALRRFADAERCFEPDKLPHEWALCVANQGRPREASRVLAEAGLWALAAMALESAGDWAGARHLWEKVVADGRLRAFPYETALARFNLGQALRRVGAADAARRELAQTQRMLEELADEFETRGERERAFDCYGILLRLGKDTGSFDNVSEGYLNSIRLLVADDQKFTVLQYYEDFLEFAAATDEWHAAAALADEAADFSVKAGLAYHRNFRQRAASLWNEAARHAANVGSTPELVENSLVAAVDAASALGDLPIVAKLYASLGDLALSPPKKQRYLALAQRYRTNIESPPSGPPFPEYLRRTDAYQDVWRQDLVEWELAGRPEAVLVQLVANRLDYLPSARLALRALLLCADQRFSLENPLQVSELALALGRVQAYEILRPLEELGTHPSPRVRGTVMMAVAQVFYKRSYGLVRRGLSDPEEAVRKEALRALRALHFRDGLQPLVRIVREFRDEPVRRNAVEAIADIGSLEAGLFLLDFLRHETGPLFDLAARRLQSFPAADLRPALQHCAEVETGPVRDTLRTILASGSY